MTERKTYYEKNKERIHQQYAEKGYIKQQEYNRNYYIQHKEQIRARQKVSREENKEYLNMYYTQNKEYFKMYYILNKEKIDEHTKQYRIRQKELKNKKEQEHKSERNLHVIYDDSLSVTFD